MPTNNNFNELSEKICAEVQSFIPTRFERGRAHDVLQSKIKSVLDSHFHNDSKTESRRVTILLSDIRGFTSLAETFSAMTVVDLLNRYFSCMTEVIVRYGGTIDKLMGDSMMVLFGAPTTADDDVERAIACAIEMQRAMSGFNKQNTDLNLPEMFMGVGINTGEVVAGPVGSELHQEYTVIGDEVNLASRIEARSLRGQILISENTYRLAKSFVLVGEPNIVKVKGKHEAVTLYDLQGTTRPRALTVPRRDVRKSPRINIEMPCDFFLLEASEVNLNQRHRGEVVDISYNGLLMVSPILLEALTDIKIEVSLHLLGKEMTDIYARVLKVEIEERGVLCSLEFTSMDSRAQITIKDFVDSQFYES